MELFADFFLELYDTTGWNFPFSLRAVRIRPVAGRHVGVVQADRRQPDLQSRGRHHRRLGTGRQVQDRPLPDSGIHPVLPQYAAIRADPVLLLRARQLDPVLRRRWLPSGLYRQLRLGSDLVGLLRRRLQHRDFPLGHRGGAGIDRRGRRGLGLHAVPVVPPHCLPAGVPGLPAGAEQQPCQPPEDDDARLRHRRAGK